MNIVAQLEFVPGGKTGVSQPAKAINFPAVFCCWYGVSLGTPDVVIYFTQCDETTSAGHATECRKQSRLSFAPPKAQW